jgi:predicted HTH transcriptional regulator
MDIKTLIAECTAYDFKLMLEEKRPKSWLKSVSAFANGLGGSLFFGIDSKRPKPGRMPLDGRQRHPSNFHFGLILILFHLLFSEMVIGSRFS